MCGERAIEAREEVLTAVMVMLPGIFAIKNDGDENLFLGGVVNNVSETAEHIVRGRVRVGFVVHETEGIGNIAIAKDHCHVSAGFSRTVGLVEVGVPMPWLIAQFERAGEYALVGRKPAEPGVMDQREQLGADGSF